MYMNEQESNYDYAQNRDPEKYYITRRGKKKIRTNPTKKEVKEELNRREYNHNMDRKIQKIYKRRERRRKLRNAALVGAVGAGALIYHDNKKFEKRRGDAIKHEEEKYSEKMDKIANAANRIKDNLNKKFSDQEKTFKNEYTAKKNERLSEIKDEVKRDITQAWERKHPGEKLTTDRLRFYINQELQKRTKHDSELSNLANELKSKLDGLKKSGDLASAKLQGQVNKATGKASTIRDKKINQRKNLSYLRYKENQYKRFKQNGGTVKDLIPTPKKLIKKGVEKMAGNIANNVADKLNPKNIINNIKK